MRLVFDPALDGAGWPGPLGDREAVAGEAWVGPLGLLGVLETQLGLGRRHAGPLERACRLARSLRGGEGFWRASFDRDPVGTSRRLLRERDILTMWGWQGQPVSPRLAELHRITEDVEPGLPDRLGRVVRALTKRPVDIASVTLFSPPNTLEPLWRNVLKGLEAAGVRVDQLSLDVPAARGDLGRARDPGFVPAGDGSLSLLRRYGSLDTADEVASALAALTDLTGVVIINGDAVLDRALASKGLPTLGTGGAATAASSLVSLVVEAAFEPMEPEDLHALLTVDPGPIPRVLAVQLMQALRSHPGRRSPGFAAALTDGLTALPADRRDDVQTRVSALLTPAVAHEAPLPVEALRQRLHVLRRWAHGRVQSYPSLELLSLEVDALVETVELLGQAALTRTELRRLCSDLGASAWTALPAQAGLAHVASPGALLGPARTVIWWEFTREHAPRPARLFLTGAEERALVAAGMAPPDLALVMAGEAQRWRRPLTQTTDTLVLVCPRTGADGEPNLIHPLWDELAASARQADDLETLEVDNLDRLAARRAVAVSLRPLPPAIPSVRIDRAVTLREVESPSSIERLLGCSLAWALHYPGRLRPGLSEGPALLTPLLMGSLAHDLLAEVFGRNLRDPAAAAHAAAELFEREAPRLCEALDLPRYQVPRATLKRVVVDSARELTRLVVAAGAQIVGTEMRHETTLSGQRLEGHLDLVLSSPDFVIDLKWGKKRNREMLVTGAAVQLAAYSAMRGPQCAPPVRDVGIGYFILRTQDLLTEPGAALAGGHAPGKHGARVIWKATVEGLRARQAELAGGLLLAPGTTGEELASEMDGTRLRLAPACGYCQFGTLCGRSGAR